MLRADADALDEYASGYRERLRAAIEADLANLGRRVEPPTPRPQLHDVDVVARAASPPPEPAAEAADPAGDGDASGWDPGPATRSVGAVTGFGEQAPNGPVASSAPASFARDVAPSSVSAPPRPAADWPPPAPVTDAPAPGAADSTWLGAADEWAPGDAAWEAPAPWEREAYGDAAAAEPLPAGFGVEAAPLEATAIETDSLDDDAFFASLREAVRDDAPLGPRDEDQNGFYDNGTDDRRRFRRRR
jgi:hypothetical protein